LAGPVLRAAGLKLDERDARRGDPLPDLDRIDGVLSLGGEQSLREIDRYPYLIAEQTLLAAAVDRGLPTLGICLGGQLLARSQGATIGRVEQRVVGWPDVERTEAAGADRLFGSLPSPLKALHWNEDYFEVPGHAVELLSRSNLGGEAVRFGESAWGVQFHPDAEERIVDGWYRWREALEQAGVSEARARAADAANMDGQRRLAEQLFGAFAGVVAESAREGRR
jgi:GMP synthase-like glutamine amidotransferase